MFLLMTRFRSIFSILSLMLALVQATAQSGITYQKVNKAFGPNPDPQVVADWLEGHFAHRLPEGAGFQLRHDIHSPGGRHFDFALTYQGLPVFDAGAKVNLFPDGRVASVMNQVFTFQLAGNTNSSVNEAALQRQYEALSGPGSVEVQAGWKLTEGQARKVFRIDLHPAYGSIHERVWVRADNGTELEREVLNHFCKPFDTDTPGIGHLFIPDPITRSESEYGQLFTDNNDQHDPIFDGLLDTVTLRDLTFENGLFKLKGPFVHIQDLAPRAVAPVTSPDGKFYFTRDSAGFEDVMVYYHIDTFQRYVQRLGFSNLGNTPTAVDPHGMGNSDNSSFVPGVRHLLFGEGGVDDAEDADVIIHEYGHALSDAAAPNTNSGRERRGLDEGIGDYIAAAYSLDTRPYNWFKLYSWDGHNEFWAGRTATSSQTYPPPSTNIYKFGEIWASTLIELRQTLGAEVMDRLVLQQMYSNYINMTLPDGALLLLDADTALYGGVHAAAIQQAFCFKQVLIGPICLPVSIDPEQDTAPGWTIRTTREGELGWDGPEGQSARLSLFSADGRRLWSGEIQPGGQFDRGNWPSGMYLLRLEVEGKNPVTHKWICP